MHLLKFLYFISIGSLLWFFFLTTLMAYLFIFTYYSVKEENSFYFEEFEKSFFVLCLLQIFCPIFIFILAMFMDLLFISTCIL
jgi:hypothetical protein